MSMFFNFLEFEIGHFFYISQLWQRFEFYECFCFCLLSAVVF